MPQKEEKKLENAVRDKLKLVLDPELGVSVLDLGLVYSVSVSQDGFCKIIMTLTTIGCPLFGQIQKEIEEKVMGVKEINDVEIELTFDPPWTMQMMSPEARIELGLD